MSVVLTKHSKKRSRTRLNISSIRTKNDANLALERGVKHNEVYDSKLKWFMNNKYYNHSHKCNMIVYNGNLYFFKKNVLITVYPLPEEYVDIAKKIQKEKKNGDLGIILNQRKEQIICKCCNSRMKFIDIDNYECISCGNLYDMKKEGKSVEGILKVNAKEKIFNLLGENLKDERVQKEMEFLTNKNYLEILFAKKITDYLNSENEYYLFRGNINNLYITYLLGISKLNPINDGLVLPYELVLDNGLFQKHKSLIFNINVSKGIKSKVVNLIDQLSESTYSYGILNYGEEKNKILDYKFLIPLDENAKLDDNYFRLDHSNVIEINIFDSDFIDDINYFINKYGMPAIDIKNNDKINENFFVNRMLGGITGADSDFLKKQLSLCDENILNFKTYEYLHSGSHGHNLLEQFKNEIIDSNRIHNYPTTLDALFSLCVEYGLSIKNSTSVCEFVRKGIKYRAANEEEWQKLYNMLPEPLANYLDNTNYMFPLAHSISFCELNYLEMYYKMNVPDFYNRKLGDLIYDFEMMSDDILKEMLIESDKQFDFEYSHKIKLYMEYKNIK